MLRPRLVLVFPARCNDLAGIDPCATRVGSRRSRVHAGPKDVERVVGRRPMATRGCLARFGGPFCSGSGTKFAREDLKK